MNEMRKLMEAVQLNEYFVKQGASIGDAYRSLINGPEDWLGEVEELNAEGQSGAADLAKTVALMSSETQRKLSGSWRIKLPSSVAEELDMMGNQMFDLGPYEDEDEWIENVGQVALDVMDILTNVASGDDYDFDEAYQGGKTEHTGPKKGKGAYYGRKKEAKRDSNKKRRGTGKDAAKEVEETVEIIGEGRTFVNSGAMVMWMLGALERMQLDYNYGGEVEEQFEGVMSAIEDLINEMKDAEIKTYPSRPTHGRRPGRGRDLRRPN